MTEKEIMDVVTKAISETNSVKADVDAKISELNSQIEEKDVVIAELNASVEQLTKALEDLRKEQEGMWEERNALEKALGEARAKERVGELNEAIKGFSDEEKKYAESEINSFNLNPMDGNVDAIVSKIYAGIGQASKKIEANRIAEQNSAKDEIADIYSEINSVDDTDDEDVNIF